MSQKKEKEKVNTSVLVTALICITILESLALLKGFDGTLLTIIVGVIAALAGVVIPTPKFLKGGD